MNIGIYVYDDAEVLDFAGPYEVFSTAARLQPGADISVFLVGRSGELVSARNGFKVMPDFAVDHHPSIELLLIPGGVHTAELAKPDVIDWIRRQSAAAAWTASVCTGAFLLAEAGVLSGRRVTTHWEDIPALRRDYPGLEVLENVRWLEAGNVVTSAGISAGIDMSLALVGKLFGRELAVRTARQMEYTWSESKERVTQGRPQS